MAAKRKQTKPTKTVPNWMDPVLKLKKPKRKSAIRKKVDQVYRDRILPNRDEREPEIETSSKDDRLQVSILDTNVPEEPIIRDFDEIIASEEPKSPLFDGPKEISVSEEKPKPKTIREQLPYDELVQLMQEKFSLNRQLDKRLAELPPDEPRTSRPLRRPSGGMETNGSIMKNLQSGIKAAIQMALRNDDTAAVCKYAQWLVDVDQEVKRWTPVVNQKAVTTTAKDKGIKLPSKPATLHPAAMVDPELAEAYAILKGRP